jgi:aminoglycoside phosphotransferase (APT) family kinase protein
MRHTIDRDLEELRAGLEAHLRSLWSEPALRVTRVESIPEGHSGFTYFVDVEDGGHAGAYVMRMPPPGAKIRGTADVVRQGRIMAALHEAGLPAPAVPVLQEDPVLDGRPYILMERTAGERIETASTHEEPEAIARSAIATLRRLQELPPDRTGIGHEDPVGLDYEMMRWAWLMERAPEELTGAAADLGALLAERKPAEQPPCLVHGDYHYGNMLFRGSEVVAVLDWEIAQLGQPLIDLGCLCLVSQRRAFEGAPNPGGGVDITIPRLVELYGADPDEFRWYLALSCYKYASIFGYNLMLHRRGKRPDAMYEDMTGTITGLIDRGRELLEGVKL